MKRDESHLPGTTEPLGSIDHPVGPRRAGTRALGRFLAAIPGALAGELVSWVCRIDQIAPSPFLPRDPSSGDLE